MRSQFWNMDSMPLLRQYQFADYTAQSLGHILSVVGLFDVLEMWTTQDVRPDKQAQKWINVIIRAR